MPAAEPTGQPPSKPRRPRRFSLRADMPMPEAGRAIMAFHFARLRKLERAAASADEEAIHDMRVAIRRVRAAFRIARPYYKPKSVRSFNGELRALADELGAARDLDVIIGHAQAFVERQPPGAPALDGYLAFLRAQRAAAQQRLLNHLGSRRLAKFNEEFQTFLSEPGAAVRASDHLAGTPRVRDAIPAAIWQQYSVVRAYEAIDNPPVETLHALRIDCKRLRYLLEFFQTVLGRSTTSLINLTVRAQDHLGLLHDATVAADTVRRYVAEHAPIEAGDLAAAAAYLSGIQNEIQARRDSFPDIWREIVGQPFRRQLARLLSKV